MKRRQMVIPVLAVLMLTACASMQQQQVEQDQLRKSDLHAVDAVAGQSVHSFRFSQMTMYATKPLSEHDLLVYTRPNKAWLLNLGDCPALTQGNMSLELPTNGQIRLADSVVVHSHGMSVPCRVQEIRPVDVSMLKHDQMER